MKKLSHSKNILPKRLPRGFGATVLRMPTSMHVLPPAKRAKVIAEARNTVSNTVSGDVAELMQHHRHVMDCINVDTIGLVLDGLNADLTTRFAKLRGEAAVEPDSLWSRGRAKSQSGQPTIRVWAKRRKRKQGEKAGEASPCLYLEGSPAVHHQGHNIVSSGDLLMHVHEMTRAVHDEYSFPFPQRLRLFLTEGRYGEITRLDVAVLVRVPDGVSKAAVINAVALALAGSGASMSLYSNQSVYFEPSSQLQAWKLYDKAAEMRAKRKKFILPESEAGAALTELCDRTLRLEFVFRKKYFDNHPMFKGKPVYASRLSAEVVAAMVIEEIARVNLQTKLHRRYGQDDLMSVPLPYRSTLAHWQSGRDVRQFLSSEGEVDQHSGYLRRRFKGLDILAAPPAEIEAPLKLLDILHPKHFVPVPDAIKADASLYHHVDMREAWQYRRRAAGPRGVGTVYVDPYHDSDEPQDGEGAPHN